MSDGDVKARIRKDAVAGVRVGLRKMGGSSVATVCSGADAASETETSAGGCPSEIGGPGFRTVT